MSRPSSLEEIRSHNEMARASLGSGWEEYASEAERDREDLLAKVGSLRDEIRRMEEQRAHGWSEIARLEREREEADVRLAEAVEESERRGELLNDFAYAVAPISVIGDRTSDNDPWANALEMMTPAIEVQKIRTKLEFFQSPPPSTDREYLDRVKELLAEVLGEALRNSHDPQRLSAAAFQVVRGVVWSSEREMKKMFEMAKLVSDLALEASATAAQDRDEVTRLTTALEHANADIACLPEGPRPAGAEPEDGEETQGAVDAAAGMLVELTGNIEAEMLTNPYWGNGYSSGCRGAMGGAGGDLAAVFDPAVARKLVALLEAAQHGGGEVAEAANEVSRALLLASQAGS